MNKKKDVKEFIDSLLNEKAREFLNKVDNFQNQMIRELDEVRNLETVFQYDYDESMFKTEESGEQLDYLNEYVKKIAYASSQVNLLNLIVDGLQNYCSRTIFFLLKDDRFIGWKGAGFSGKNGEISNDDVKNLFFSFSADTTLTSVIKSNKPYFGVPLNANDDNLIYRRLGGDMPIDVLFLPFAVRGKPQAVIYCDRLITGNIYRKPIEIIAIVGELSLEVLPIKQKIIARVKTTELTEKLEKTDDLNLNGKQMKNEKTAAEFPEIKKKYQPEVKIETIEDSEKTSDSVREKDSERFVRVTISDINLYRRKEIEEGIKNGRLFYELEDVIMQAKENCMRKGCSLQYFEEQLIKIIARGNKELLKGYPFEFF